MVLSLNGIIPFEIQTNGRQFVKKIVLNPNQNVQIFNGTDYEWSGFRMVGTIAMVGPFQNQTI